MSTNVNLSNQRALMCCKSFWDKIVHMQYNSSKLLSYFFLTEMIWAYISWCCRELLKYIHTSCIYSILYFAKESVFLAMVGGSLKEFSTKISVLNLLFIHNQFSSTSFISNKVSDRDLASINAFPKWLGLVSGTENLNWDIRDFIFLYKLIIFGQYNVAQNTNKWH